MSIVRPEEDQPEEENILMKLIKELRGNQTPEQLGAEISGSAPQQLIKGAVDAGSDAVDETKDFLAKEPAKPTDEAQRSQLQQLLLGRATSHAKPMGAPWHAPMVMPNTPRDISAAKPPEKKSAFTAADLGQDPTATPLPSSEDRAKMNGALRLPGIEAPIKPTMKDLMSVKQPLDDPKGLVPSNMTREEFTREGPSGLDSDTVNESSAQPELNRGLEPEPAQQFPQSESMPEMGPAMPGPTDQPIGRSADDPRERLKAYLARQEQGNGQAPEDQRLAQMLQGNEQANGRLGLYSLIMKGAAQAGAVGDGKIASTEGFDQFIRGRQDQNNRTAQTLSAKRSGEKKAQEDKLKGMMFLAKQQQDDEKYRDDLSLRRDQFKGLTENNKERNAISRESNANNDWFKQQTMQNQVDNNRAILDLKRNPPKNPVDDARVKLLTAQAAKADKEAKAPPKPAAMAFEDKDFISKLAKDNGTAVTARNNYEGFLRAYDSAPTESAKINFVRSNLKTLQSMEGPDAINGTDEPRLMGYLNQVRPGAVFQDGGKVFGTDLPSFRADIQRRIDVINTKLKGNQDAIRKAKESGSLSDMTGTKTQAPQEALQPGMKWQVNTKTGARRQVPAQ